MVTIANFELVFTLGISPPFQSVVVSHTETSIWFASKSNDCFLHEMQHWAEKYLKAIPEKYIFLVNLKGDGTVVLRGSILKTKLDNYF